MVTNSWLFTKGMGGEGLFFTKCKGVGWSEPPLIVKKARRRISLLSLTPQIIHTRTANNKTNRTSRNTEVQRPLVVFRILAKRFAVFFHIFMASFMKLSKRTCMGSDLVICCPYQTCDIVGFEMPGTVSVGTLYHSTFCIQEHQEEETTEEGNDGGGEEATT